jgi:hypothetical protein
MTFRSDKKEIERICKERGTSCHTILGSAEFCQPDCAVSNYGTPSFEILNREGLIDEILDQHLFGELLAELEHGAVSDRGTVQSYSGYSTLNQKMDSTHSVTAPQIIASTSERSIKKMVQCTSLIKSFCGLHTLPQPWDDDPERTRDWAQRLCDEFNVEGSNRIEQMTFALTCMDHDEGNKPLILGSHVDHLNDPRWPEVFCIYRHFFRDGKLYRLAAIAYSRLIIGKYRFKDIAYNTLKTKVTRYLNSPSNENRIFLSLASCVPCDTSSYRLEDGVHMRMMVPFLDKAGFYSGFADAILQVWDGISLERACELLIIVGWISTATSYQKILSRWKMTEFRPNGIWTLGYLEEAIDRFGGLTNGPGARTQPWMNFPLKYGDILGGLNILRNSLLQCQSQSPNGQASMPYAMLHRKLGGIMGVGPLGAQHLIGVASLLGIIPCSYQNIATIAESTNTCKKVKAKYLLSATVLEKQKEEVAEETGFLEKIVESGYCEMLREEDVLLAGASPSLEFDEEHHAQIMEQLICAPRHPDTYFHGQILRTVRGNDLVEMYWDADGQERTRIIMPTYGHTSGVVGESGWWVNKRVRKEEADRVICTSKKHCLASMAVVVAGCEGKRMHTRGNVVHTGFGVHSGLEARLREGDKKKMLGASMDSDGEDKNGFVASIVTKKYLQLTQEGMGRVLRSAARKRFPPTELIEASYRENGTYQHIDIDQRVYIILNNFKVPRKKQIKSLYRYTETCELKHMMGFFSYSAVVIGPDRMNFGRTGGIGPARKDSPTFWETGYTGSKDGIPYYSTKENARRAVAFRILVDYYTFILRKCSIMDERNMWPQNLLMKSKEGYVVLYENGGRNWGDDCLFCILVKHAEDVTILVPRTKDYKPWKEVRFESSNWDRQKQKKHGV